MGAWRAEGDSNGGEEVAVTARVYADGRAVAHPPSADHNNLKTWYGGRVLSGKGQAREAADASAYPRCRVVAREKF